MTMKTLRKLTVHRKFRSRTTDVITVPEIRLQGKWLLRLDFEEGREVEVEQGMNKLTITIRDKVVSNLKWKTA